MSVASGSTEASGLATWISQFLRWSVWGRGSTPQLGKPRGKAMWTQGFGPESFVRYGPAPETLPERRPRYPAGRGASAGTGPAPWDRAGRPGPKCVLIPARQVTLQELPVAQTGQCPIAKQVVDLPQQDSAAGTRHRFASSHRMPDHLC